MLSENTTPKDPTAKRDYRPPAIELWPRPRRADGPTVFRANPPKRPYRVRTVEVDSTPKTLLDLGRRECRYCVADTPEGRMHQALFCAAPILPGRPYCPAHQGLASLGRKPDVDALTRDLANHLARTGTRL